MMVCEMSLIIAVGLGILFGVIGGALAICLFVWQMSKLE